MSPHFRFGPLRRLQAPASWAGGHRSNPQHVCLLVLSHTLQLVAIWRPVASSELGLIAEKTSSAKGGQTFRGCSTQPSLGSSSERRSTSQRCGVVSPILSEIWEFWTFESQGHWRSTLGPDKMYSGKGRGTLGIAARPCSYFVRLPPALFGPPCSDMSQSSAQIG